MRFRKLYILFVLITVILRVDGQELLDVKFTLDTSLTSPRGIQKIVKINDLPGFSYALHLQTVKLNDKLNYTGWSCKFNPKKQISSSLITGSSL